jgi:Tfp pilus assembly protein FimV
MFYKALVRRCRQTAIGAQADRMRWFPILDAAGNPKPYQPRRKETAPATSVEESIEPSPDTLREADNGETPPATRPVPGRFYTVHFGDSISAIANAVSRLGQPLTPKEILEANPDLDPARLKVGQKILIPTIEQESETNEPNSGPLY